MKRMTLFAGALVLLLVAGMVGAVSANEIPAYAVEYPLYAGQTELVGAVFVWNEADLHVFYDLEEGWCMTESHLEVAKSLDGIPQTKKGNPIPGQFTYGETYASCVGSDEFVIPLSELGATDADQLFIAAHARVWASTGADKTETVCFSSAPGIDAYGPLSSYALIDDLAWGTPASAVSAWTHSSWPSLDGATWISTNYTVEAPYGDDSWRRFSSTFDITDGFPLSGTVRATADNAEEFYINGDLVYTDGEVQGAFVDDHEWGTIVSYDFTPVAGTNTYDFIVRNYPGTNTQEGNPTALIYEICYTYSIASETAWGAQKAPLPTQFDGKNWATYFTYDVQGWWEYQETVEVLSDGSVASSVAPLVLDVPYRLDASGYYRFANWGEQGIADAECSYRNVAHLPNTFTEPTWISGDELTALYGVGIPEGLSWLEVAVNGADVDWNSGVDSFNSNHEYSYELFGTGSQAEFKIWDDAYGDNSGFITVKIYKWV